MPWSREYAIFLDPTSTLSALEGLGEVREKVGAFVGIVAGAELRRLRAVRPAIDAINWAEHDEEWY